MTTTPTVEDLRRLSPLDWYAGLVDCVNSGCWRHAEVCARALFLTAAPSTPAKWLGQAAGVIAYVEARPEARGVPCPCGSRP